MSYSAEVTLRKQSVRNKNRINNGVINNFINNGRNNRVNNGIKNEVNNNFTFYDDVRYDNDLFTAKDWNF